MTQAEYEDFIGYLDEWLSIAKKKLVSFDRFISYPPAVEYSDIFNELTYMDFEENWGRVHEEA